VSSRPSYCVNPMPNGVVGRLLLAQLALLMLGGCREREPRPPQPTRPQEIAGLPELVAASPAIVIGRVERLAKGRVAGPEPLQFQDVVVAVESYLKGGPQPDTLVLEQPEPKGRVFLGLELFSRGDRLLLFVRPGQGGHHVALGQGRYRIEDGTVKALQPGPVADKINGMQFEQFRTLIESP
jgi:hypothetical protein